MKSTIEAARVGINFFVRATIVERNRSWSHFDKYSQQWWSNYYDIVLYNEIGGLLVHIISTDDIKLNSTLNIEYI
jgi:hypothetical protein